MKHSCKGVGRCKRSTGYKESTLGSVLRGNRETGTGAATPNAGILRPRTVPGPFMAWQQHWNVQNMLCLFAKAQIDGIHHSDENLLIPEQARWTAMHRQGQSSFFCPQERLFCSCSPHELYSFSTTQSTGIQTIALLQTSPHPQHPRLQTLFIFSEVHAH